MPSLLGPYELRGKLGSGAMAVVWRAWDPKLEREVAIKEPMRSPGSSDAMGAELTERFVIEGRAAARLSHPGIVTIYAADVFDGRPAIVMELLRGQTLSGLIDRGVLPWTAASSILEQLLEALDYAHAMGVVHRDIKPDNVFVTDDGRVKLTDFGVAHLSRIGADEGAVIAGTPGYMAPEQVRGEPTDARADIFGIGVIAYEMLVGFNPFGATDGTETTTIMYRTVHGPDVVFDPACGVGPSVQAVVLRALSRERSARFGSAGEMSSALRSAASASSWGESASLTDVIDSAGPSGTPFTSMGSTLDALKERTPKRGSTPWIVGTAAAIALVGLGFLALLLGPNTADIGLLVLVAGGVGGVAWWLYNRKNTGDVERSPDADVLGPPSAPMPGTGSILLLRGPAGDSTRSVSFPCVLGRSAEADVVLDDDLVSRLHARLEARGGEVWVVDLVSRNGTFLDGVAVGDGAMLRQGSVVAMGSTEVRIVES